MTVKQTSKLSIVFNYSLIKYIAFAIGFVRGIINAKFLGPELIGVLGNLTLILSYCSYAHLGVLNAMNSEYMLYKDKQHRRAEIVIESSYTFLLFLSLIFLGMSLASYFIYKQSQGIYLLLVFIIAVFEQFKSFYINYARLLNNYKLINIIELIYNALSLVIIMLLINVMQITGVLIAMLICGIAIFVVGRIVLGKIRLNINKKVIADLIIIGIPLLIYNLGFYILTTIDRWIIISFLDYTQLGYYTFANQIVTATLVFINSILFLYYPKAIKDYNESNDSSSILGLLKENTRLLEIASVVLIVLGIICIYPFVKIFLPNFMGSITVYSILLLAVVINSLSYFANVYIVSNKRQVYLVALQVIAIALNLMFNYIFIKLNLKLYGVALATMISNMVYSLIQHMIFNRIKMGNFYVLSALKMYWKIFVFMLSISILVYYNISYWTFCIVLIFLSLILYGMDYIALLRKIRNRELRF